MGTQLSITLVQSVCLSSNAYSISCSVSADASTQDEEKAWDWLDSVCTNAILNSIPARTVQHVQPALHSSFFECCVITLRKIQENPEYEGAHVRVSQ